MCDINKYFLEQALLGYQEFMIRNNYFRKTELDPLMQRKYELDCIFEFTEKNIARISEINEILKQKEKAADLIAKQFEKNILETMSYNGSFISDYEIDFKLHLFAEKKYADIKELEGNPFFEYSPVLCFHKSVNPLGLIEMEQYLDCHNTNFNEFQDSDHPLKEQNHCFLFHDLYDHTPLAWQDIVDIEEIWYEVILILQNLDDTI